MTTAVGMVLSFYGYRFEVPWKEVERERNPEGWIEVTFTSGPRVRFANPAFFRESPISGVGLAVHSDHFRKGFGASVGESKYQQFKEVVSATPSQLSPFRSRTEFARMLILLDIKGVWFEHNAEAPDIFSFQTKGYRGFEISGLSRDWQQVRLDLFDSGDHWLRIDIFGDHRSGVRLTQPEINRIIYSFAPAPSA